MEQNTIDSLGDELYNAMQTREAVEPLTSRGLDISLDDAYRIQERMVAARRNAGESVIGKKIGVTSKAVQNMLNVHQPDFGWLLSDMLYNEGQAVAVGTLIQPRAEGEIAFLLKKDLEGPGITAAHVLAATEAVMPCFEIVDSRIRDWKIRIEDTIADNASCGVIMLGESMVDPRKVELTLCGMVLEKNGELAGTGVGAAALGHPAHAVAWLANTLGSLGIGMKAGEIVLSGALSALVPVQAGDNLKMQISGIGGCSLRFV